MSFSANVKKELAAHENKARHCDIAELAAILNACGEIIKTPDGPDVRIVTENPALAKKVFKLIKKTFQMSCVITMKIQRQFKKKRQYRVKLTDMEGAKKLLLSTGLMTREANDDYIISRHADVTVVKSSCCMRAYLRGAFLAAGSLSDPEKGYHLEFVCAEEALAESILSILRFFELNARVILRKSHFVVYLKEGENIVDALNIMAAHVSLLDLENVRIMKDMRNNVNRIVNCETANLSKTVDAAVKQAEDIRYIQNTKGLETLSEQLAEAARLRLLYPEASLKEIGAMLSPAVGKSGVNHRLRKLSALADQLREGHYD